MNTKSHKNLENVYFPSNCKFYIDTNNLISPKMMDTILDKFNEKIIKDLGEKVEGIKFLVGGNQWHFKEPGFLSYPTYEIDFRVDKVRIFIYLAKIFKKGFKRWENLHYGALKRFVWESFCHEIIMCLLNIVKLNKELIGKGSNFNFNIQSRKVREFVMEIFGSSESRNDLNFISIGNELWKDNIPRNLGFLNILYSRKIDELNKLMNKKEIQQFQKIKYFNELRKIKLNYKYEYNLSELINYCLYHENLSILFKYSRNNPIRRNLYYKLKRIILKFFKKHDIILKEYLDSADRKHLFLSHKVFEKIKSVCLQLSIEKIRLSELQNFEKFKRFYSKCPICKNVEVNSENCERLYFSPKFSKLKKRLVNGMQAAECMEELNSTEYYFGIPCNECYDLTRSIEGKISEINDIENFLKKFSFCPICHTKNHPNYLISFYYDKSKEKLKKSLLKHTKLSIIKGLHLNWGIPCCNCFSKFFGTEPEFRFDISETIHR